MIKKFEFWQSGRLDSEVLTSEKCFMTNGVDFKQFNKLFRN